MRNRKSANLLVEKIGAVEASILIVQSTVTDRRYSFSGRRGDRLQCG